MASFTSNYQLHQWEPEDHFLRTDFNQDFAKIDAAIKAVSTSAASQASAADAKAQRALNALEPLGYNLYSLMLQNYYDSKVTGNKKALLFDGFSDASGIASRHNAIDLTGGRAALWGTAAGCIGTAAPSGTRLTLLELTASPVYEVVRTMDLNTMSFWVYCNTTAKATAYIFLNSEKVREFEISFSPTGTVLVPRSVAFSALRVKPGDKISFYLHSRQTDFTFSATGQTLDCNLTGASWSAASGTITGVSRSLPSVPASAQAWVRHSGGTVALSLGGKAMTKTAARSTVNLRGEACTETSFRLDGPSANVTPVLTIKGGSAAATYLYDYGVMFF